jgi:pimeloyl-ACP methyl ester carboxylesterase
MPLRKRSLRKIVVCLKVLVGILVIATLGARSANSHWPEEGTGQCNASTGLSKPLGLCTIQSPCRHQKGYSIVSLIDSPSCTTASPWKAPAIAASPHATRPFFRDKIMSEWLDNNGTPRHACVFRPEGISRESPRPLVLWLHGGEGSADNVYTLTSLRQKAPSFDLSGDSARPGFILVSIQGRNIHFPTGIPPGSREGAHHDFYFRDLRTNTENSDLKYYDHLLDSFVTEGIVDPKRIYVMGWSNGGFMAQLYALARFTTPTPGGNHVAAAVAFGAADPFNNTTIDQRPSCQLDPYPTSKVPIYLIQRSCDAACACSPKQMALFSTPPGYVSLEWVRALQNKVRNPNAVQQLIDDRGNPTQVCDDGLQCLSRRGILRGLINHARWPDGVADRGGRDWEVDMLTFLKRNSHF